MPSPYELDEYVFKMPFATSIHPQLLRDETLSILLDINASLTPSLRLPREILHYIREEVHRPNEHLQNIRSTWTAVSSVEEDIPIEDRLGWVILGWVTYGWDVSDYNYLSADTIPLSRAILDADLMKYRIGPCYPDPLNKLSTTNTECHISSADLLYRLRCLFPEIYLGRGDRYSGIWEGCIYHNESGLGLGLLDYRAGATLMHNCPNGLYAEECEDVKTFSKDAVTLLNALIGAVDSADETQFPYFHPTAWASRSFSDLRYVAVPIEVCRKRDVDSDGKTIEDRAPYYPWRSSSALQSSLFTPFRSILSHFKYDVKSRKIDPINGTTPLTEVISSALLYYRLRCKYEIEPYSDITLNPDLPIITSVWRVELGYKEDMCSHILFMDDRGLFDIQANEAALKRMDDIVKLLNALCSDECLHPYGRVAGCAQTRW